MGIRYSLKATSLTPTATADTVALANTTYLGLIQGGTATQRIAIREVSVGGESASTSAPTLLVLARDSTVGVTVVLGSMRNALLDATSGGPATAPVVGNSATTLPQRSAADHLLALSMNAYGGIMKWKGEDDESPTLIGNVQPLGEVSLSAYTGGTPGPVSSHIIYEVM